jgi:hypothetical protein
MGGRLTYVDSDNVNFDINIDTRRLLPDRCLPLVLVHSWQTVCRDSHIRLPPLSHLGRARPLRHDLALVLAPPRLAPHTTLAVAIVYGCDRKCPSVVPYPYPANPAAASSTNSRSSTTPPAAPALPRASRAPRRGVGPSTQRAPRGRAAVHRGRRVV